jgi:lysozyme
MAFNLGINRLVKFRKMLEALGKQDYQAAADQMLDSLWVEQVGDRAKRLADLMRNG